MGRKDKVIPPADGVEASLGTKMRLIRQQKGISITELSRRLKYTKSYLSSVETGIVKPSQELVDKYEFELALEPGTIANFVKEPSKSEHLQPSSQNIEDLEQQADEPPIQSSHYSTSKPLRSHLEWNEAPDTGNFYGRQNELSILQKLIVDDCCRVVSVLGIGGIGKTMLTARVISEIKGNFDYIFWRSLQNTPPPTSIFIACLQFISNPDQIDIPESEDDQIELLREYMQKYRCLLVLDNFESVLQSGESVGDYGSGLEGYGKLIEVMGEMRHQSCLVITSREKPKEIARLEGNMVRTLALGGLGAVEGKEILKDKHLFGNDESWESFIRLYSGNPLALRLASAPIYDLFQGDIAAFLREGEVLTGDVQDLLDQQFQRLSEQEREILFWLSIEREPVSLNKLRENIVHRVPRVVLFEALDSLRRRSMIESSSNASFSLQPVILEYVTNRFVESAFQEIKKGSLNLFESHALIMAQAKDYVRDFQVRLILQPLSEQLLLTFGKEQTETKLRSMILALQETRSQTPGYTAGNIINLLIQLGCEMKGYDFSNLVVWQAYLKNVALHEVNFANCDLAKSVFMDAFGGVLAIALSPNGEILAAGTTSSEIRIWDTGSGTPLLTYQGHTDWVRSVAFSSDGTMLASAADDQTVRTWDVKTGECLKTFEGHIARVYSVTFSQDGKMLASGGEDQTVRLWEVSGEGNTQSIRTLHGHTNRVRSVAFSPDERIVASGSEDQTMRLWNTSTGECLKVLQEHEGKVWAVAFSPDGRIVASGSEDQTLRLWEVNTGRCLNILKGHSGWVRSIAFSYDGNTIASGSEDQTVRLWEVSTGETLKTLHGHTNMVLSVAFSADGSLLASGSEDQTMRIWRTDTGQCLKLLQGYSTLKYSVAFSPDGQLLVNGNEDQTVRIWEVSSGQCLKILYGHTNRIRATVFSPDGQTIASGSDDHTIRLWETRTGQLIRTFYGHKDWIKSVAFSPDGHLLASGSDDQTIRIWNVDTGQTVRTLYGHQDWVWAVAFSPDGQMIASGSGDQTVRLWKVSTGECLTILRGHTSGVWAVAFSPDGNKVASSSHDYTIGLWDVHQGRAITMLRGHTYWVKTVAFSPDGSLLASGSGDQTLRLWEVDTGKCLKILQGHTSWIYSLSFKPDGSAVASCSSDGTIRLWDVQTGNCLMIFKSGRPYENMNITNVIGLSYVQKATLRALGAVER